MPKPEILKTIFEIQNQPISLAKLELVEVVLPLVESFQSAIGGRTERRALLVKWIDRDGAWGVAENSCRPDPFFNGEFLAGAIQVIGDFLFPLLPNDGALKDYQLVLNKARNWPFTTAAVLDAALDLLRRKGQKDALDLWSGKRSNRIPVGISFGLFPSPKAAVLRVGEALARGYRRVKLKIHPGMNTKTVAAIRSEFPHLELGFDANGSGAENDFGFFKSLAQFHPVMLEQPFAPARLDWCQKFKQQAPDFRLCLDESITSLGSLLAAHQLHAFDEINLKPGRVGGQLETVRILNYCVENNIPAWVGGMFETGIGRSANLRVAALLPEARAHDLSPSDRYFRRDVLESPITMDGDGAILLQDKPTVLDENFIETCQAQKIVLKSKPFS